VKWRFYTIGVYKICRLSAQRSRITTYEQQKLDSDRLAPAQKKPRQMNYTVVHFAPLTEYDRTILIIAFQ